MIDGFLCILLHTALVGLPWYFFWPFCFLCGLKGKTQKSYWNWFEVLKLLSVLLGSLAMDLGYDCELIFRLNILEAVVAGYFKDPFNSLFGLCLAWAPLNIYHACLYSAWNARFSYMGGFSHSTRLILLVPFLGPWSHHNWLRLRGRSLLLNMALRASQWMDIYTPGRTFVTS